MAVMSSPERPSPLRFLWKPLEALMQAVLNTVEIPMRWAQRMLGQQKIAWVFLLPNLLIFGLFTYLPIGVNFLYATTGGTNLWPGDRPFLGMDNFEVLLDCENYLDPATCRRDLFWVAVYNSAQFVVLQVGFMVTFALITALILNRKIIGRGFWRSVFFYPVLLSPVVVALIWKWILQREGVLNAALVGLGADPVNWLLSPDWAFFWVVFVNIWFQMGFYTLILLAGLQAIPPDVYEAAEMDGTKPVRVFTRITLPLLMPTMIVVLVLALIRAVQAFDEIFVLTGGGPGSATMFIVQYIYETGFASQIQQFGIAAAASLLLAVVLFILTMLQLRATRRQMNG